MTRLSIRPMSTADAPVVAALHVASWRTAYRDILTDDYLALRADEERRAFWAKRLASDDAGTCGLVAVHEGVEVGFAFMVREADAGYGNLLDNLHVSPGMRGQGIGRRLLSELAREVRQRGWNPGLYLWVFETNAGARRFYERHGALPIETAWHDMPDGGGALAWRYSWPDAETLLLDG